MKLGVFLERQRIAVNFVALIAGQPFNRQIAERRRRWRRFFNFFRRRRNAHIRDEVFVPFHFQNRIDRVIDGSVFWIIHRKKGFVMARVCEQRRVAWKSQGTRDAVIFKFAIFVGYPDGTRDAQRHLCQIVIDCSTLMIYFINPRLQFNKLLSFIS